MNQANPLLSIPKSCEAALPHVLDALQLAGLQTVRSFDLKVARSLHSDCICPNHGTEKCDCQLVVVLVYGHDSPPATLIAHGRDRQTQFHLVDSPQQHPEPVLELSIRQTLASVGKKNINQWAYQG
jgi:hypothetical protein